MPNYSALKYLTYRKRTWMLLTYIYIYIISFPVICMCTHCYLSSSESLMILTFILIVAVVIWRNTGCSCEKAHHMIPLWRHDMETLSALLALSEGTPSVDSFTKGQWYGAWMFPLVSAWTNCWTNGREQVFEVSWRSFDITLMHIILRYSQVIVMLNLCVRRVVIILSE